jgi:DNA-directed RNA polymerase II subunit RPB2
LIKILTCSGQDYDEEITQEDTWTVISSYFEEKGLVRQQLDSFNDFIEITIQEIVNESPKIVLFPESAQQMDEEADSMVMIFSKANFA